MKTQEMKVANQTSINIVMKTDAIGLDEVVAIGYGTMRKSDLTGAVVSVDVEKMAEMSNVSVIQSMQGSVAGLNIGAVDAAGENPTISVRGQSTISSGSSANSPLVVVDGSIYRGNIIDINSADIASVDILKDASSAAIYGSQATNGVILITTKSGIDDSGKPTIAYSGSYTLQTPSNELHPMRYNEFEDFLYDAFWYDGSRTGDDYLESNDDFYIGDVLATGAMADGYDNGVDHSLWDLISGNGYINKHNISVRGKTKSFGYFFSGGLSDVKGYLTNDTYSKYNYRVNMDAQINKWLQVGMESFYTRSDYSGVEPNSGPAFYLHPWSPIYDDNGDPLTYLEGTWYNPLLTVQQDDSDLRGNLSGNFHAEIKLPIEGLSYRANFSQNYRTRDHYFFNEDGEDFTGYGYKKHYIWNDYSVDNIVTYKNTFNKVHNVNATLVYGVEKEVYMYSSLAAQGFSDMSLSYDGLANGNSEMYDIDTEHEKETSLYSMARLAYNYSNKYLITGTVRRDGYSGFGEDDKYGIFPSVALGWVASEEAFVKDNLAWADYLKLRVSYGSTGRRAVEAYDTQSSVTSSAMYSFGDGASASTGQYNDGLVNSELGWETTTGINVGLDFAVLSSRIHGNIEYYRNNTKDALYSISIPYMTGFSSISTNIGKVANHGIEFTIGASVIKSRNFSWEASVNFSRNRNEIVSILGQDDDGDGVEDDLATSELFIGEPTDVIYDYNIIGMYQMDDTDIPSGFYAGTYKIEDISGADGVPDGSYSSTYDKKVLGYEDPSYRLGIANTFRYKNFSLYTFINTIQGGNNYYMGTDALPLGKTSTATSYSYSNVPEGGWDYWMPENTNARFRRLDAYASYNPERYMQRNFVRLQDVSLSYNLPKKIASKLDMSNFKVFVSGKNLITLTKWRGWDPETGQGFELGTPLMKNWTIGVNVEF
jgi:TonB-linked SusC/RagA family outer membrane protein